jgi:plastocyanin
VVNEIIINIVYELNNLIGIKEYNLSPAMTDNSQSFSLSSGSADNVAAFDSEIMETSVTIRYTFQESGLFEYYCTDHPNTVGKVVVS